MLQRATLQIELDGAVAEIGSSIVVLADLQAAHAEAARLAIFSGSNRVPIRARTENPSRGSDLCDVQFVYTM
jgi:hypothetical protein